MRGKDLEKRVAFANYGITPAYAGKSGRSPAGCFMYRDHPRLCGEKAANAAENASSTASPSSMDLGSPPPMRGKEMISKISHHFGGITPAYAGKRTYRLENEIH